MFSCLLIGAFIESDYKWGFYVFALASLFYIAYHLLSPARGSARLMGVDWGRTYTRSAGLLVFVWVLYVSRSSWMFSSATDIFYDIAGLLGSE
jgi:bacteriorhodopsin